MEIPLKLKYRCSKTKGRYKGGEHPAPKRKHPKKGAKTYVYGSHVLFVQGNGKKVMKKVA